MQKINLSKPKITQSIEVGDSVKVLLEEKELLWVEVTEVMTSIPKKFNGKIDVDPVLLSKQFGDEVNFDFESIYAVLKKD